MRNLAALVSFENMVTNWMASLRPVACAVSHIFTASTYAPAMGFSQKTSLPDSSAATVAGMW